MVNHRNTCSKFDFDTKRTCAGQAVHSDKNHHSKKCLYTLNRTRTCPTRGFLPCPRPRKGLEFNEFKVRRQRTRAVVLRLAGKESCSFMRALERRASVVFQSVRILLILYVLKWYDWQHAKILSLGASHRWIVL